MKGISTLVSHAIYVALGIVVMGSFLVFAGNLKTGMDEQSMDSQLSTVAEAVRQDIVKLYLISKDSATDTGSIAKFSVGFPEKIGGRSYTITLSENLITVTSAVAEVKREVDVDISLEGSAVMPACLELVKESGEYTIKVVEE